MLFSGRSAHDLAAEDLQNTIRKESVMNNWFEIVVDDWGATEVRVDVCDEDDWGPNGHPEQDEDVEWDEIEWGE